MGFMKTLIVEKSHLVGELSIPSSKSQTHRALLFAAMASGKSIVHQPLQSFDTQSMIDACRHLGAKIEVFDNHIEIYGVNGKIEGADDVINTHNSGIVLRFISAIAALGSQPIILTGDYSIRYQRPMQNLLNALGELGALAISTRGNGFAPIVIRGPIKPGKCQISDGADSQNVSALLIAGSFLEGPLEIDVEFPGEKPWIDMTLDWMKRMDIPYENRDYENYKVQGKGSCKGFEYNVSGDWSSAAFPLAAALVTQSKLTIKNLNRYDCQGDKKIVDIFMQMGANIQYDDDAHAIHVFPVERLKGVVVDINDCIDAITILAVVACFADGETRLINAAVAKQKECDRITCISSELQKMGANIDISPEGLRIKPSPLRSADVLSYGDHRMAMSLAVAGLGVNGVTRIQESQCIGKTYPSFIKDFQSIGANIGEIG